MSRYVRQWLGAWVLLCLPVAAARADSLRPLAVEEAATLPSGVAEASIGLSYSDDGRFPGFTPPGVLKRQTLLEGPQLSFRIGAGGWAEFQASYETIYLDEETVRGQTNTQFGGGDARIWTKIRLARERELFPGLALHFGTKLPNAERSTRLGTDDTDFGASAVVSKDFGPVSTHLNLGIMILGNSGPTIGHSFDAGGQDDLFTYDLAVASPPLEQALVGAMQVRLLAECVGQTGSHFGNDRDAVRGGLQLTSGAGTLYVSSSVGLVTASENIGASAGFIYRFEPAQWFSDD